MHIPAIIKATVPSIAVAATAISSNEVPTNVIPTTNGVQHNTSFTIVPKVAAKVTADIEVDLPLAAIDNSTNDELNVSVHDLAQTDTEVAPRTLIWGRRYGPTHSRCRWHEKCRRS